MKYCVIPCCAYDFYVKVSSLEFSVCVFNSSYWLKEMCEYTFQTVAKNIIKSRLSCVIFV